MAKKTQQQLAEEYFTHMVGKSIDGVMINEHDELEILLNDDSIVVIYSSEDLSLEVDYPKLLN